MNFLSTSCISCQQQHRPIHVPPPASTNLYCPDIGVLGDVLVLVEGVLGEFPLLLLDGQLDEQDHNRLERGDGDIAGPLRRDVLVQQGQGRRGLVDPDELVGPLQDIFGFLMGRGGLGDSQSSLNDGNRAKRRRESG
jgi:hypothetical protein